MTRSLGGVGRADGHATRLAYIARMSDPRETPTDSQRWVADRATPITAVLVVLAIACAAGGVSLWRGGSTWIAIALGVLVVILVFQVLSTRAIAQHVASHATRR